MPPSPVHMGKCRARRWGAHIPVPAQENEACEAVGTRERGESATDGERVGSSHVIGSVRRSTRAEHGVRMRSHVWRCARTPRAAHASLSHGPAVETEPAGREELWWNRKCSSGSPRIVEAQAMSAEAELV